MVSIVGAGPGDVELITVKGLKRLKEADLVIYAGSLVNKDLIKETKEGCTALNSAYMSLEEVMAAIQEGDRQKKAIVRLHTGDPCIYGAIREQMDAMDKMGIAYEVIPGVSSFCGAAAALRAELTLPEVTQTVILTRMEGRTGVPETECLEALAKHRATMVLFLSVDKIEDAMEKLREGYGPNAPAAVVYKATWEEQRIIRGTVATIAEKTRKAGIAKTALIFVSHALGDDYALSKLYDKTFETGFRKAQKGECL